ncbi:MAG TPA: SAM-dependent methyltransferase, partial [Microbacterium ginsengisoli]|nr:SAM-dependent methyltransferase [Microbacterium ginsengisoli]
MTFDVPAEAYQRFMGRYSEPLAQRTLDVVGELDGVRAL